MTVFNKMLIGGAAGVCLVLMKLIQANFYLGPDIPREDVLGGFVAAGAFVAIALIFVSFLEETNPRSLFTQGLAALGVLIALASTTMQFDVAFAQSFVREFSILDRLSTTVHAMDNEHNGESQTESEDRFPVQTISEKSLKGSLADGASRFFGRVPSSPHAYVIGKTSDIKKARGLAEWYENTLGVPRVRLLQLEGFDTIFLAFGDISDSRAVSAQKEKMLQNLNRPDEIEWEFIEPLISGRVMSLRKLSRELTSR